MLYYNTTFIDQMLMKTPSNAAAAVFFARFIVSSMMPWMGEKECAHACMLGCVYICGGLLVCCGKVQGHRYGMA